MFHTTCLDAAARDRCPRCGVSFEETRRAADQIREQAAERRAHATWRWDQIVILAAQVLAFAAFASIGRAADRSLGADQLPTMQEIERYRTLDAYAGYALAALGVLWVVGIGRAAQLRSSWRIGLVFLLTTPLLFAAGAAWHRLS